jgi:hypothetical protein
MMPIYYKQKNCLIDTRLGNVNHILKSKLELAVPSRLIRKVKLVSRK